MIVFSFRIYLPNLTLRRPLILYDSNAYYMLVLVLLFSTLSWGRIWFTHQKGYQIIKILALPKPKGRRECIVQTQEEHVRFLSSSLFTSFHHFPLLSSTFRDEENMNAKKKGPKTIQGVPNPFLVFPPTIHVRIIENFFLSFWC